MERQEVAFLIVLGLGVVAVLLWAKSCRYDPATTHLSPSVASDNAAFADNALDTDAPTAAASTKDIVGGDFSAPAISPARQPVWMAYEPPWAPNPSGINILPVVAKSYSLQ